MRTRKTPVLHWCRRSHFAVGRRALSVSESLIQLVRAGPLVDVCDRLGVNYSTFCRITGGLGGDGADGPMHGELVSLCRSMYHKLTLQLSQTQTSVHRVVEFVSTSPILVQRGLQLGGQKNKTFADIGSGMGKVLAHVLVTQPRDVLVEGIEIEFNRWFLGTLALRAAHEKGSLDAGRCSMVYGDFSSPMYELSSSIIYAFDTAFPTDDMILFAELFNRSEVATVLISFHAPAAIMFNYGFEVRAIAKLPSLRMHGSQEGKVSVFFLAQRLVSVFSPSV